MEQINNIDVHKEEIKIEGDDYMVYYFDESGDVIAREYVESASAIREEFEAYAKDGTFDKEEVWR